MSVFKNDDDSPSIRLHRLVDLTQIRIRTADGVEAWRSWRAYLNNLPEHNNQESTFNGDGPVGVLVVSALRGDPSLEQLADISVHLDAPPRYFDMIRPRHEVERDLLVDQLCKVGAGGLRICRGQPAGFELVEVLESVLSIVCRSGSLPGPRE
ncbi:hypothetical protein Ae706Ps2_6673 [Pseudonocardia sp. Ae706_Ps2]|uniref:hypothetical protein n=1 Tax=unclassified Pseudonocardia TaxID=2619320 RepID=UPI000963F6AD|nr:MULTISPECIES: hypothetical protein [unclassified Pseudonocardia]OLM08721.1 hypothetical protein Ae706Ps2_6673 [Pseudonocardia sp. Ae706_Ps2]